MVNRVIIRELVASDQAPFIAAMQRSQALHHPWVKAPSTPDEFDAYFQRYQQPNQKSYLVCDHTDHIGGVFNINEIVRGLFQSAYLGFYAVADFAAQGYMSAGLKTVLEKIFNELKLHRIEANIQPENKKSIQLVKSNGFRYEGFSPRYLKINDKWCGHEHWAMTCEDFIRNDADVLKKDHIEIAAYDPKWPEQAQTEINRLRAILPASRIVDIQHVGSTAIPAMPAKPIVDIQIAAYSLEEMKTIAISALQKLGYEYWYDNPDPERMFFAKGMPPFGDKRTHHVHIVEPTSKHWRGKILFRDYLIAHPEAAQQYHQLKMQLAEQHKHDREQYTAEFINKILLLAEK